MKIDSKTQKKLEFDEILKLLAACAPTAGARELALALLPGLLASAIFAGESPVIFILWFLTILALDFMLSTVRFMINALVPVKGMDVVKSMIQIMIKMFVIFILVIVFAVGFLIASWIGALVANIIVSVIVGGLLFAIYPSMLHRGIN